jgi:hypothetical protein
MRFDLLRTDGQTVVAKLTRGISCFSAIKVKHVCVIKHDGHEDGWDSEGIASDINLGTRWRWVVRFTPRPLYPQRNSLQHSFHRIHGGSQSWAGHCSENKNPCSCQELNPGCPAFSQSACLWFISRSRQYLDRTASNSRMTDEWWIGSNLEGSGHGIIRAIYLHLRGDSEKYQDSRFPGRVSKQVVPEYKSRRLPICRADRYIVSHYNDLATSSHFALIRNR